MSSVEATSSAQDGLSKSSIHQILYADCPNVSPHPSPWAFMNLLSPDGGTLLERMKISRAALLDQRIMYHELIRLLVLSEGEVVIDYQDSFCIKVSSVTIVNDREVFTPLYTITPAL